MNVRKYFKQYTGMLTNAVDGCKTMFLGMVVVCLCTAALIGLVYLFEVYSPYSLYVFFGIMALALAWAVGNLIRSR